MGDGTLSEEMEEFFRRQNIYIDGYDFGENIVENKIIMEMYNNNESIKKISKYVNFQTNVVKKIIDDIKKDSDFFLRQQLYFDGFKEGVQKREKEIIIRMVKNKEPIKNISKYLYIPQDIIREIITCYEKSENSN